MVDFFIEKYKTTPYRSGIEWLFMYNAYSFPLALASVIVSGASP